MEIPDSQESREAFYQNVRNACLRSRGDRIERYNTFRQFFLYGTGGDTDQNETYNKIYPHIDQIVSFMYSQETTTFQSKLGAAVPTGEMKKVGRFSQAINDHWHASNGDIVFGNALLWAHVYGTELLKHRWDGKQVDPSVIDPHNFGVLREDISQLSKQEAFCQVYQISSSQLSDELKSCEHPALETILKSLAPSPHREDRSGGMINQVIASSISDGVITGNVGANLTGIDLYVPESSDDMVEMYELYLWDSKINGYRIVTIAAPGVPIFDRALDKMFVKDEQPFVQICPTPVHDYFWGISEVERLIPLQMMRNTRMYQIQRMMDKQAKPPKSFSGFPGITDELAAALDSPAGYIQSEQPGAKVENLAPDIPDDLFKEIKEIDYMFEEMSGMTNVLSGRGESGVRSSGHANQLAKLGSSRAKKRALVVEDSLEKSATLYAQMMQHYDDKAEYMDEDGVKFSANQFPDDYVVKVDAHSNSPIFMEDQEQKATELLKAKAITRERFIQLLHVPMEQLLIDDLRTKIEPQEKQQAEREAQQQKGKAGGGS